MSKAICSECGCPIEIVNGEEWAYCPMCDNDQVEVINCIKKISDPEAKLAITEKALELACDVLRDINYKTFNDADVNFEAMFEKQAKEMLEDE